MRVFMVNARTGELKMTTKDVPEVVVSDLGITRGDGIFESFSLARGAVQSLDAHIARLEKSAVILDLADELDFDVLKSAVVEAAEAFEKLDEFNGSQEYVIKLVVTRGPEECLDAGICLPTVWLHFMEFTTPRTVRIDGIKVVTLDRGYSTSVPKTSPWLLQGAKTLSYAVNKAVGREAKRRGADDVLFISSDGFALEGPTSNLLARFGSKFVTTRLDSGVLEGTTQKRAFDFLEKSGYTTAYELVPKDALYEADGLWLLSSGRQAAAIKELDGQNIYVDKKLNERLNEYLLSNP
ncbi:MAG: aminotransferase class IV [Lactobacillales bacterium]|jgi:4-amino-4-deoxychorismate lyase|nr:aminotransferase class IV [Lactobacillales bacterium]